MAARKILLLGNPRLQIKCAVVKSVAAKADMQTIRDLHDTLMDFRRRNGFGRGIAAPQIGILKRIIYIYFPKAKIDGPLINPRIRKKSKAKIRLWDDCFSFPDLLVRVERAKEVAVTYLDTAGEKHTIFANGDLSELLQHEIDHLDGVLAVQRAIAGKSFALRGERKKPKNRRRSSGILRSRPTA